MRRAPDPVAVPNIGKKKKKRKSWDKHVNAEKWNTEMGSGNMRVKMQLGKRGAGEKSEFFLTFE